MDRKKSIELLNKAVSEELTAIHQYMYFHFVLDDMGLETLAGIFKKIAIDEMLHTERFAERILFLGGEIEMKPAKDIIHVREPKEILRIAMESENEAIDMYNDFALQCANNRDMGTKQIFENTILDEEKHDIFETELNNLQKYGDSYLSQQAMERSRKFGVNTNKNE